MSADSLYASVLILPNPQLSTPEHLTEIPRVKDNITFAINIATDILTLYTGSAARGDDISGLLYVPELNETRYCPDLSQIPANVTHKDDLPNANYDLIGFAPWISGNCSQLFLKAAGEETSTVRAFIFFTLDPDADIPSKDDDLWSGVSYRNLDFPIYAIGGSEGIRLMGKVAEYSGNMSDVWEAHSLTHYYNASDYARVFMEVDTGQRNPLPGLWLFLLVVLAVLIVIVGLTSLSMHWLQYQHRQRLRRRVASGQVDLEALGIKRLSVPRKILDGFPIRVYVPESTTPTSTHGSITPSTPQPIYPGPVFTPKSPVRNFAAPDPPLPPMPPPISRRPSQYRHLDTTLQRGYSQTQCPICLDDFTAHNTLVRELPCLHVFHPGCIDPFLETQSSLCPLCKASALPQGYVPPSLTNATVRRERNLRRMRARVDAGGGGVGYWWSQLIPGRDGSHQMYNMHAHSAVHPSSAAAMSEARADSRRVSRRNESFRDTAASRVVRVSTQVEDEDTRGRPKWKRAFGVIFPGFQ